MLENQLTPYVHQKSDIRALNTVRYMSPMSIVQAACLAFHWFYFIIFITDLKNLVAIFQKKSCSCFCSISAALCMKSAFSTIHLQSIRARPRAKNVHSCMEDQRVETDHDA